MGVDAVAGGVGEETGTDGGAVAAQAEMLGGSQERGVEVGDARDDQGFIMQQGAALGAGKMASMPPPNRTFALFSPSSPRMRPRT